MRRAVPTEYRGVTYRSKTEAIFALSMDLAGGNRCWGYESRIDADYSADFVCRFHYGFVAIELKPAVTTLTYKRWLADRQMPNDLSALVLCWVDVFHAAPVIRGQIMRACPTFWATHQFEFWKWLRGIGVVIPAARNYRFDLQSPEGDVNGQH